MPSAHMGVHAPLQTNVLLRRLKKDVMNLLPKLRSRVEVEVDPDLAEVRSATATAQTVLLRAEAVPACDVSPVVSVHRSVLMSVQGCGTLQRRLEVCARAACLGLRVVFCAEQWWLAGS